VVRALRTGEGATVDVTAYEPLLHALGTTLSSWDPDTPPPDRDGGAMGVPLRGTFQASDGDWIAISASTPRQQQAVADLVGAGSSATLRRAASEWIATVPAGQALAALVDARVPASIVNDLAAMANDPQVTHRGSLQKLDGHLITRPTPVIDAPRIEPSTASLSATDDDFDRVIDGWRQASREMEH
jgi:crotonobetainyl-CoA:carnitine CoA-transferase CaiB-like acyl-CoA transferase